MGINKVNYGNTTLIDISGDTVTAGSMLSGTTAHDNSGAAITGTIASKSSSDLTASGATVTVPAGYYSSQASKSVASGTAGTPTATKGTVSNHAISVTPSVTNTAGYMSGGTKTGTAVSVSASELVSGNKAITANGTGINVANYSTVSVSVSASPNLRELSVTPTTSEQIFSPNSTSTLVDNLTTSGSFYSGTASYVSVSTQLVSGRRYFIKGYIGNGGVRYSVIGEWVCGTSLTPYMESGYSDKIESTSLTPTQWTLTPSQPTTSPSGDYFELSLKFYQTDSTSYDGFSFVTVGAATSSTVKTTTVTNSSNTATTLTFSDLSISATNLKAFTVKLKASLTRNSSNSYYYITTVRYNGTNTQGNYWRMSTGNYYDDTSHYSFTVSSGTISVKSSASRSSAGGSFYNGTYELTYVYG